METITVYVPSKDKKLNNRVYNYDRKDQQWYVETPVEKMEDMVVMTKGEFELIKEGEFQRGYDRGWESCYLRKP